MVDQVKTSYRRFHVFSLFLLLFDIRHVTEIYGHCWKERIKVWGSFQIEKSGNFTEACHDFVGEGEGQDSVLLAQRGIKHLFFTPTLFEILFGILSSSRTLNA